MSGGSKSIKLREDHLRLIYDGFRLLDDNRDGFIDQSQYATLTRALGQTVSDAHIARLWSMAIEEQKKLAQVEAEEYKRVTTAAASGAQANGRKASSVQKKSTPVDAAQAPPNAVGFQAFVKVFIDNYIPPESEKSLIQAFQLFDKENKGVLSLQQLQEIVTSRGEPLPKAEFEELVLVAGLDGQKTFDYTLLAKRLVKGPAGIRIVGMLG